jgi:hypothetical protein
MPKIKELKNDVRQVLFRRLKFQHGVYKLKFLKIMNILQADRILLDNVPFQ